MAEKTIKIEMKKTSKWVVVLDPDSEEVKAALDDYQYVVEKHGEMLDMINHVIWYYDKTGSQDIEGVGHITVDGEESLSRQFPLSGINLIDDGAEYVEYEISSVI